MSSIVCEVAAAGGCLGFFSVPSNYELIAKVVLGKLKGIICNSFEVLDLL